MAYKMKERTLGIRDFWREIVIILILAVVSYYMIRILPVRTVGILLFLVPSVAGGYLIAKKGAKDSHALLIPAAVLVLFFLIMIISPIIKCINTPDEEFLMGFSNEPQWANYPASVLKLMSIAGMFVAIAVIIVPIGIVGAWAGSKLGLKFPANRPVQTE